MRRRDALAGAAAATAALAAGAEPAAAAAESVRGSWKITPKLPPGAPPFVALAAFAAAGVFITSGSDEPGTGIGSWRSTGRGKFAFAYTNFHFDSSGRPASTVDVRASGTFRGKRLSGTATLRRTDPSGAPIGPPQTSSFRGRRLPA